MYRWRAGQLRRGIGLLSGWTTDPRWRGYLRARGGMRPGALHRPGMRLQRRRRSAPAIPGWSAARTAWRSPVGPGRASPRTSARLHRAPARGAIAPAASRGTAMPGWSAVRTDRKSRVGPGPALPRHCAPPPCTGEGCACNGGVRGRVRRRSHLLPDGPVGAGRSGQLPAGRRLWTAALHRQRRRLRRDLQLGR